MSIQSTIVPTPKSALPQHQGRPVPWITRWDGEVSHDRVGVGITREGIMLRYEDGHENRDPNGLLWKREGITRRGAPQWAEVNTYRQRAAMRKRLCQVCGSKINERPIRWLIDDLLFHVNTETGEAVTRSAPTCSSCIPLALELCPHLKSQGGWKILKVLDYEMWGVYGSAVMLDPETGQGRELRGVHLSYKDPQIEFSAMMGYQEVALLTKYVIEDEA